MSNNLFFYIISLFVILNPLTPLLILISITSDKSYYTNIVINKISLKCSLAVFIGSLVIILFGKLILDFFSINVSSFRVMGGLVLVLMAIGMIQAKITDIKHTEEEKEEAKAKEDFSIIPLAIPSSLGSGTISTLLVYRNTDDFINTLMLIIAMLINSIILYIFLRFSKNISRRLGSTGVNILVRLMGLIVGSLGVQFIVYGIKELWFK